MNQLKKVIVFIAVATCAQLIRNRRNAVESGAPANLKASTPLDASADKTGSVYAIKRVYELALKQREFEISQLTQRNNFFMIFQGVLIGGLIQSQGTSAPLINFLVCLVGMCVSIFQIGMAGGAKYWQIRWEVAVKELELRLFEAMQDSPRMMIQLFTVDEGHLSESEKRRIEAINQRPARKNDKLSYSKGVVAKLVKDDLTNGQRRWLFWLPWRLFARIAVLPRFSVSKIPLWVGLCLFLFWSLLWLGTFSINGRVMLDVVTPNDWIQLQYFKDPKRN